MRAIILSLLAITSGCALESGDRESPIPTGQMCTLEQVPEGGFSGAEAYLETQQPRCEGEACLAFRLQGDPREICEDSPTPNCALASEVERRMYCTCRCDGAPNDADECVCPIGFACIPVFELGGPGVEGSYCVRNGTF